MYKNIKGTEMQDCDHSLFVILNLFQDPFLLTPGFPIKNVTVPLIFHAKGRTLEARWVLKQVQDDDVG
jgi:hypothetical protein